MAEEEKQRPIAGEDDDDDEEEEKESETETEGEELEGDEWEGDLGEAGGRPGPSAAAAAKGNSSISIAATNHNSNSSNHDGDGKVEVVEPVSSLALCLVERRAGAEAGGVEESASRRLFQRLWTDEEEIRILQGFLEFTQRRGTTFASHQYDTGPFYEEIRQQLHLDFSKNQLIEKLRRLKKKYRNCAARMRSKGPAFSFRSPHEHAIFEIARHIWRPANKRLDPSDAEDFSISFSTFPPSTAGHHPDLPELDISFKPTARSSGRRARRRLHHDAPPPPFLPQPHLQPQPHPQPAVTAAIPVSVSPPVHHEAAAAIPLPPPLVSSSSSAAAVQDTVRSCLSPLFKELIGSAIGAGSLGLFGLGPMPACPPGKSGDDKWRKQQILELEVYLQRIELVREQVMLALQDLKGPTP